MCFFASLFPNKVTLGICQCECHHHTENRYPFSTPSPCSELIAVFLCEWVSLTWFWLLLPNKTPAHNLQLALLLSFHSLHSSFLLLLRNNMLSPFKNPNFSPNSLTLLFLAQNPCMHACIYEMNGWRLCIETKLLWKIGNLYIGPLARFYKCIRISIKYYLYSFSFI